jgi:hypothetical protein
MDTIKLPPFSNVAPGQLATLSTTALNGMSVHAIIFALTGVTKAQLTNIKVTLNAKQLVSDLTGTQLQSLNSQKGLGNSTDYLMCYFGNPRARTIKGQHITDLDQSLYAAPLEFQLRIDAGASAPGIEAYALVNPPKVALGLGYTADDALVLKALLRTVLNPANAINKAAYDIAIGSAAGAAIESMAFFHANMTSLEVKKSGVIVFEDLSIDLNSAIQTDFQRAPEDGLYVWQPTADGNMGQAVATVKPNGQPYSMQFLVTTSAADTITVYTETATKLGLI